MSSSVSRSAFPSSVSTDAPVRPDVAAFLQGAHGAALKPAGLDALRDGYAASKSVTEVPVGPLVVLRELAIPGPAGPIPATLFDARAERAAGPLLVFFHGGGFVMGSVRTHASLCAELARALDLPVLSVDYRLAPEHPWPAAPDDAEAAARWAAGSPAELGREVRALVLDGDSAGGNLAIVAAMQLRDRPAAVPAIAQLLFYPLADPGRATRSLERFGDGYLLTRGSLAFSAKAYRADPADRRAAPMRGALAGMPPAVVMTAGVDPIRDEGRAYAAALVEAGVPVAFREAAGNIHGFATLRRAIGSSAGDVAQALAALRALIAEVPAG
ncbi:MAG: alpha/beta hydrolase [Burkholderia sp.]